MSAFLTTLSDSIAPYYYFILAFICIIIFTLCGYYAYNTFYVDKYESKKAKFSDTANANMSDKEAVLYFFHVDWCPHCKTAMPEWQSFLESGYDGREIGDYVLTCKDIDCTNEDDPEVMSYINKYTISGFPTIKLLKDGAVYDFEAKIKENSLEQFVEAILSE
jgi:thiol-disulfide isomerase/thioredoxin